MFCCSASRRGGAADPGFPRRRLRSNRLRSSRVGRAATTATAAAAGAGAEAGAGRCRVVGGWRGCSWEPRPGVRGCVRPRRRSQRPLQARLVVPSFLFLLFSLIFSPPPSRCALRRCSSYEQQSASSRAQRERGLKPPPLSSSSSSPPPPPHQLRRRRPPPGRLRGALLNLPDVRVHLERVRGGCAGGRGVGPHSRELRVRSG